MRWLTRTIAGLLVLGTLAVLLAGGALWLLGTEAGTQWVFARLLASTGEALTVRRVSGTLLGGFVLDDVRLRLTRDELDIPKLTLQWNPAYALLGELAFSGARADSVAYRRLPSTAPPSGDRPFAMPFPIRLDDAFADSVSLTIGGSVWEFGASRGTARYAGRHLVIGHSTSEFEGLELDGDGDVIIDYDVVLTVHVNWAGPALGTDAAGRVSLSGTYPVLEIHHELTAPFPAVADGELGFEDTPRADLNVTWQNLVIPGVADLVSPTGSAKVVGTLADYRVDGSGTLDIDGRAANFTARSAGARGELTVEELALDALRDGEAAGTLRAHGLLSAEQQGADAIVLAEGFDPAWIHPSYPGRLNGMTELHAKFAPTFDARFAGVNLDGELRRYAVQIHGAAEVTAGNRWQLDPLRLDSGPNVLVLDGALDPTSIAMDVSADVQQLDLVFPGVGGAGKGDVKFSGTWAEPHGAGSFEARSLAIGGFRADRLAAAGEAGLEPNTPLELTIDGAGLEGSLAAVDEAHLSFAGTTSAMTVALAVTAEDWRVRAAARGGVDALTWRGTIDSLDIDEDVLGNWRLEQAARALSAGRAGVTLDTSCLLHVSGARFCAQLGLEDKPEDQLVFSAQNVNLSTLKPLLPPQLTVDGVYQLSASFSDLSRDPHGAAVLTGGDTQTRVAFGAQQAYAADLHDFRATATLEKGRFDLAASVMSGNGGHAEVGARIDDVRAKDSSITGDVAVQWPDLGFLMLLSPQLGEVSGSFALDLDIGGTVNAPTVDGRGGWSDGRVGIPAWGLVIGDIQATATSADGRSLDFDATGKAGDGEVKLTGRTDLKPSQGWPTRLELTGNALQAVQIPEAQIYVTPDLDIDVALPDVRVQGTVLVPRAMVELSALPAQAVAPSPDAVVHGETVAEARTPLRLVTHVDLKLGDDVRYSGLNLATKVTGGIRFDAEAGRSAAASGTLQLAGTYNAYGQELQLERGQLLFNGPLDNPGLDVRAARTIETTVNTAEPIRVGIELAGTVKSPRTRVFSTPSMTEADALSYLLLGRPVTGTGSEETATLQTAALAMGLQQALPVVQRLGKSLGLDELSVQTTDTDAGALMAGKYLSPKVYIRYSYGLFNRIGGLLLRFKVNDRFSIETRSGNQESMDLLYTVEKD